MKRFLLAAITFLSITGFAGVAYALPYFSQTQSMLPGVNDTYNIGTSSPSLLEYNNIFTKNITVSGTCTGCGGGSGGSGTVSTSSSETANYIPFWTSTNGTPATLSGGVSTLQTSGGGLMSLASSTIGAGGQATGLTISGGATTTGNAYFASKVGIGTTSPSALLTVEATSTTGVGSPTVLFAISSTSSGTATTSALTFNNKSQLTIVPGGAANSTPGYFLGDQTNTNSFGLTENSGTFQINGGSLINIGTQAGTAITQQDIVSLIPRLSVAGYIAFENFANSTRDISLSRLSAGVLGLGTGANGSTAGTLIGSTIGIGSTSPAFPLSIHARDGQVYSGDTLFAIGSSTSAATTTLFSVDNQGNTLMAGNLTVGSSGLGGITGPNTFQLANTGAGSFRFLVNGTQVGLLGTSDWRMAGTAPLCFTAGGSVGNGETCIGRSANGVIQIGNAGSINTNGQLQTGSIGLGTTTPFAKLAISLQNGETYPGNNAFIIASSTSGATTTLFSVSNVGTTTLGRFGACNTTSALTTDASGNITCGAITGGSGVTSVATDATLTGGTITTTGTLGLNLGNANTWTSLQTFNLGLNIPSITGALQFDGNVTLFASSTNKAHIFGIGAGGAEATTSATDKGETAIGYQSLRGLTTGASNTAVGYQTLTQITTTNQDTALGYQAGLALNTAQGTSINGTFVGYRAGYGNAVAYGAQGITAIGASAGLNFQTGADYNTLVGFNAGQAVTTGSNNIVLGGNVTAANSNISSGSNNIIIGFNASVPSAALNGQMNIGGILFGANNSTSPTSGTGAVPQTGQLGVGSSSPFARLSIQAMNGDTNKVLFAIGSSTNAATTTLFSVSNTGTVTTGIGSSASSTEVTNGKWQRDTYNTAGTEICSFYVGTTLTTISGACNQ